MAVGVKVIVAEKSESDQAAVLHAEIGTAVQYRRGKRPAKQESPRGTVIVLTN